MGWYKKCKIKMQIQLAIIILVILSTVLLGVFSFAFSKKVIEENYKDDFSYNLRISDEITDIQLNGIIESTRNLLTNSNFISVFRESQKSNDKYFSSAQQHNLEANLGRVITQQPLIGEIVVLDHTGKLHSYVADTGKGTHYKIEDVLQESWIQEVKEAKGKEVFFCEGVLSNDKNSIYMAKYLVDPNTYEGVGYMVVRIRDKIFDKAFGTSENTEQNHSFMVTSQRESTSIVYFRGNEEYKKDIEEEYLREGSSKGQFIFADVTNDITGWKLVSIVKKSELTRDSNVIGMLLLCIIFIIALLGMQISKVISGRIYEPLMQLENMIQEVGEGNRNVTEVFDESEIGAIGNKFKQMVNHNLDLRERLLSSDLREREAELLLLQSQINPHFLYNTLDSLYCMAVIHEIDDIAQMVDALSRSFKLSLNKGNKLIMVRNEVEHIKSYMEVQNFRYNNRFQLIIDIEEALWDVYIIKFILQPFVENAMYHGLESKIGKGSISVRGRREENKIVFTVEDDGIGIEDLSVVEKGFGVINVKERIKLYYGEGFGVEFASKVGVGTKVTVTVGISYEGGSITDEDSSNRG